MPWKPRDAERPHDSRLDAYRNNAANLELNGRVVGRLLVCPDHAWTKVRGHLWWRRFGQVREIAFVWLEINDERLDYHWCEGDDLDATVDDWNKGMFRYKGVNYSCHWLTEEHARALRQEWDLD